MSKEIENSVEYRFVGERIRKTFDSIDDALKHVKGKLPSNGKSWIIEEVHTKIIQHEIKSDRQVIDNKDITKRIIDYFLEHASVENVLIGSDIFWQYIINQDHRSFSYYQDLYSFLCCEKMLGYNKDQFWKLYKEVEDILKNDIKDLPTEDRWIGRGDVADILCFIALSEKYGFTKDEMIQLGRDILIGYHKGDYNVLDRFKNQSLNASDIAEEHNYWMKDLYYADGHDFSRGPYSTRIKTKPNIWRTVTDEEKLEYYKNEIRKLSLDDFQWEYNIGNYKPCHNYKLTIKNKNIDENGHINYDNYSLHMCSFYLPGIMFRNNDIYITYEQYIGRNVNHTQSLPVDVDENLYKYCIRNL